MNPEATVQTTVAQAHPGRSRARAVARLLRPHQWVKSVLVFLPLLLAHELHDARKLMAVGMTFVALCLCASVVYVVNDAIDVEKDRLHATKRRRPFATGELPLFWAWPIALVLLLAAGGWVLALQDTRART